LASFMWADAEAARAAARRMVLVRDMVVEDVDFVPDEMAENSRL